jgi:hypothetical protein
VDDVAWEHDLCADEAIAGQPVLAPEQTDPAAKGEAGPALTFARRFAP